MTQKRLKSWIRGSNIHMYTHFHTKIHTLTYYTAIAELRHATNWPANGVEHASLLLMPIDMYPQQM